MSKKNSVKLEAAITRTLVTIVTLFCIVIGAIVLVQNCCKVVAVGTNLIILNDNAQFYNEQPRKTDAMTEDFNEALIERNKFYQSEGTVTRVFSNLPSFFKLCTWLLAIVGIPAIPLAVLLHIFKEVCVMSNLWKYQVKRQRKQKKAEKVTKSANTKHAINIGKLVVESAK